MLESLRTGLAAAWQRVHGLFSDTPVGSPVASCPLAGGNCKTVSDKVKDRLDAAQEAIAYAKNKLSYGAGNQKPSLDSSNFNSYFRMQVARDDGYFTTNPEIEKLKSQSISSYIAAKAELAQGGNCGEHAFVVYDYLRKKFPDEYIQITQVKDFDHAFVMIGDPTKEGADKVVIADAWPTNPTPVLWEDHFAFPYSKESPILNISSSQGDARDYKQEMLNAGLSLTEAGQAQTKLSLSPTETARKIEQGIADHWVWNHPATAITPYDYQTSSGGTGPP
ncbi:hypothetical protein ABMY26_34705 [Azospirillum sp. HJ39]|uniref:hypothetical protein n=1 Tax=Azospirillum sp. HJ39 TaxID=3159496 RepID=UPI003558DE3A